MPVARQVLAHAATAPDRVAVLAGDAPPLTYAELAARALTESAALMHDGVLPGQVVAIDLAGGAVDALVALLAVDLAGAVALMCDGTWTPAQRAEILAATGPDHHLTALTRSTTPPADGSADEPVPVSDDDLAWGGFTSGSTGRPRAVVRSRGSWTRSFDATSNLTTITAADTVLIPGPLSTSLFCFGAVHAFAVGATVRLAPSVAAALGDLGELGACDVVHLVPAALGVVLDALASPTPPASRLRMAVVGGAALPPGARERAAAHGISVVAYYGATELSFVAIDPDGDGLRPFPGVEIEIRDPSTGLSLTPARPVGGTDGTGTRTTSGLGEVWVRSPWIAHGYLAGARGPLRTADRWASVGDLAELTTSDAGHPRDPSSRLLLRGRGTGAITVGAATVVPEDVEAVLRTVPGVRDVVVLGTPHPRLGQVVTAVVVGRDGADLDLETLDRSCRDRLSPAQRPRRWFSADALPVTGTGKPARAVVQADLAEQNPAYRPARSHSLS
ncbi:long-chain acyl-CoA synthetase [Sanguibacter gelidistatuariae]|uniref:Long-chain acyl-CoA synthetase n=1 Tax=Sanguibacter gelidistatuariae TaxID=1814289 RepID=A0A1G6N3M9_9MICO|nr:class I adenylate-forming enzyme family protein [Sanguibacter gelidistatuariae]SDC62442.1 long-chain acyl-CoA synthetase [Sanguibacter gelidistatuariae]